MATTKSTLPFIGPAPPPKGARPVCKCCGKELVPTVWTKYDRRVDATGTHLDAVGREWKGYVEYDGFHSLRCALLFARSAWAHGYRVTGGRL